MKPGSTSVNRACWSDRRPSGPEVRSLAGSPLSAPTTARLTRNVNLKRCADRDTEGAKRSAHRGPPSTVGRTSAPLRSQSATRPKSSSAFPSTPRRCEVEVPALPFRVGESIAERWGQVRGQVGEHDVDRVPVGSEFDRDLAQAQQRTRRTRGQERETGDSCPRSLSNRGEKWPSITANGFIRPPSSTPRMSWSRLLSFALPGGFEPPSLV